MVDTAFVYRVTNTLNGMQYIGVSKNPQKRFKAHYGTKTKAVSFLKNAMRKYGFENFKLEVLLQSTQAYCYEVEQKAVTAFNTIEPNGYNICAGGRGAFGIYGEKNGMFGKKHSSETLEKMRLAQLGKKASTETKQKMSEIHKTVKRSPDCFAKLAETKRQQWADPEFKAKMIASGFGVGRKGNHVS